MSLLLQAPPANVTCDMGQHGEIQTTLVPRTSFYTSSSIILESQSSALRLPIFLGRFSSFQTRVYTYIPSQFSASSVLSLFLVSPFCTIFLGSESIVFWAYTNSSILLGSTPIRGSIYVCKISFENSENCNKNSILKDTNQPTYVQNRLAQRAALRWRIGDPPNIVHTAMRSLYRV